MIQILHHIVRLLTLLPRLTQLKSDPNGWISRGSPVEHCLAKFHIGVIGTVNVPITHLHRFIRISQFFRNTLRVFQVMNGGCTHLSEALTSL